MEDVYTIKVRTKPDTRNLYPSERRYSASTVSGLAWVHLALAATSFLLACLALVNPHSGIKRLTLNDTEERTVNKSELIFNLTDSNEVNDTFENNTNESYETSHESSYILVLAPTLITVFATAAGIASIMASSRWYIDHNITWLFIMSVLSTIFAFISFTMIIVWFVTTSNTDFSEFYKDKVPFKDQLVVKHSDVLVKNETHLVIALNAAKDDEEESYVFTKRVLSINIMIAAFLELLWSILSIKIAFKGMRTNYKDDSEPRSNCVSVVTTIKGNNAKKLPRNMKLIPPKPDLIDYPNGKMKRIFLAQSDNGFYLKNQDSKKNDETNSEYKERMMNFLNRCASSEVSNPEQTPSVQSDTLNTIPEMTNAQINDTNRATPISWGDTPDHTIYNQNNINFEKIFHFAKLDAKESEETSENVH